MVRVSLVQWIRKALLSRGRGSRSIVRRRSPQSWVPVAAILEERLLLTAPTAVNDSYSVVHDNALSASTVLSNDIGGGGSGGSGGGGTLTAVLNSGVSHGSLTLNSNGTFSYTPTTHYAGSDSFTYKAFNGTEYSTPATVTISVTNLAPTALNDSYVIYKDSFNSASEGAATLLANDYDGNGDSITASLVSGPSHGSLTLNSNGSFVYTPTTGYYGSDSFVYATSDAVTTTNATVTLTVTNPFSAQTNAPDTPFTGYESQGAFSTSELTGEARTDYALPGGHTLTYGSLTADVKPVVAVEATFGWSGLAVPDTIDVQLTYGGITATTLYLDHNALSVGANVRFAMQVDASSLATGHYQYTMTVTSHYGSTTATRVYTGYQDIVNRQGSEFGPGWSVAEVDRLAIGTGGVLWTGGEIGTAWFTDTGSGTYSSPAGPMAFHTLVKNGNNTYTLTDKFGNKENFSTTGLLTSKVDRNGNTTSYAYNGSSQLTTITDPFSRVTTFNYTSGKVTSVTDIASRTTTLAYTSGKLTSITAPDPDGAGSLAAPVMTYGYDSSNRLTSVTDALSHATTLTYNFAGRLSQATFADSTTTQLSSSETAGLVNPASGTGIISNPAHPYVTQYAYAYFTNELSLQLTSVFDRFGNLLSTKDPLNNTTTWQRNANGQVTQMTTEDPDGFGGQAAEVTAYQYDSKGNLTRITYPDSTYETWTYHSTLNTPLTHTDQLSHTTTYTYDAYGNALTATDPLSNVTTNTYTGRGFISTVTGADPDGAGSLTSPVTSYTYDSYGRVTRITNPDTTHRDFTYDTSDNALTDTDELNRVTTYAYDNLNRLTTITDADPDGAGALTSPVTSYAYDAASRMTSETDPLGKVTSYGYSVRDRLTTVTTPDPDGAGALAASVTTYGYNSAGWQTTITDALGYVTTYGYDNDGRVTSITRPDPDGAGALSAPVTSYTYDNIGRKTRITDSRSNYVSYAYNSLNQITSVTDQLGKVTSYTYDALGNVLTKTLPDPDGAGSLTAPVTTYTYNSNNQLLTTTDALGYVTTNAYDNLGRLKSVTQPDPDGAGSLTSPVTSFTYDSRSRLTKVTNALGYDTQYGYDNASQLTSVTTPDPDGAGSLTASVTGYAYDNLGRLTTVTDPLSHTRTYTYDSKGQKLTETDGLGNVTTYAYDYAGRLTTVTNADPDGAGGLLAPVTTYAYDANDRTTSITQADPDGAGGLSSPVTSYTYDNLGRLITVTDPLSHSTSYEYDANGNQTKVTDSLGKYMVSAYDAANRLTSVTQPDPDGAGSLTSPVTSYGYDYTGRQITITDPQSGVTHYAYDGNGNLTSIQDPGGNTTTYTLDHLGRVITETNANSASRSFTWDAIGELTSKTDRNSRVTNYTWDHAGRLKQEDWMSGGSSIRTLTYVYDAANRLTSASDSDSAYAFSYNAGDLMTQVDNNSTPNVPRVILTMGYDALRRRTSLSASVAGTADFADAYSYDALNRMTQVTQQGQAGGNTVGVKRIDLSYNAAGNFAGVSRYANLAGTQLVASTTYGYDNDNRLTSLSHDKGATNLASYSWSFDYAGRLTGTSNADGTTSYTYDAAGQLTAADHSYQTDEAYSYDANGNRTNSGYSTTTNNRMTSDGTYNYTYDSEGNRTRKTTISGGAYVDYVWDYHNRLTDVKNYTSGGTLTQRIHYTYDVADRLIGRQIDTNGDGTYDAAARYVNDWSTAPRTNGAPNGLGIGTGLDDTLFAFNGSGTMTNRYFSGPAIDQVFAEENAAGTIFWDLADNEGTIRDVAQYNSGTNTTTVVDHLKYDSFGNITAQSDSTKQPLFTYTGRQWDGSAGLQYSRARWYDPKVGKFISEDPAGFAAGDINLSRYALNRATSHTDPSGLIPQEPGNGTGGGPPMLPPVPPRRPVPPKLPSPPLDQNHQSDPVELLPKEIEFEGGLPKSDKPGREKKYDFDWEFKAKYEMEIAKLTGQQAKERKRLEDEARVRYEIEMQKYWKKRQKYEKELEEYRLAEQEYRLKRDNYNWKYYRQKFWPWLPEQRSSPRS